MSPNLSVNSDSSTESGYISQDIQTLQPYDNHNDFQTTEFMSQLPVNNPDEQSCESSKSPIITYAVISENFPDSNLTKTSQHTAGLELAPDGSHSDFEDFLDIEEMGVKLLDEIGFAGVVQLVSFHPKFRYSDESDNDNNSDNNKRTNSFASRLCTPETAG